MHAALFVILAVVGEPIIGRPNVPDGYGSPVPSPQPIGDALLYGSQLVLRSGNLTINGEPGVIDAKAAELRWSTPVDNVAVTLTGWFVNGDGELKLTGWLGDELVGEVARPAIWLRSLPHTFEADPSWVIDRLTWEGGGGTVWAVQYEPVPEPSTLAMAVAAAACLVMAAIHRTRS